MQIKSLRELLNEALNEDDEETRVGSFWCFAEDYDKYIPTFKKIFSDESMHWIQSEGCIIERINDVFIIEDSRGIKDTFTQYEMGFIIDLWEKTFLVEPNIIDYTK
jgi:hypothetical protein